MRLVHFLVRFSFRVAPWCSRRRQMWCSEKYFGVLFPLFIVSLTWCVCDNITDRGFKPCRSARAFHPCLETNSMLCSEAHAASLCSYKLQFLSEASENLQPTLPLRKCLRFLLLSCSCLICSLISERLVGLIGYFWEGLGCFIIVSSLVSRLSTD